MPGPIFIAEQVEALQLKDRNLCPVQFPLQIGGNLITKGQKPMSDPISIVGQVETL